MNNLKNQLIKLGSDNPELRDHVRSILSKLKKAGWGEYTIQDENGKEYGTYEAVDHADVVKQLL